jgi:hypothetical protein
MFHRSRSANPSLANFRIAAALLARADEMIELRSFGDARCCTCSGLELMLWTAPAPARECHGCGGC